MLPRAPAMLSFAAPMPRIYGKPKILSTAKMGEKWSGIVRCGGFQRKQPSGYYPPRSWVAPFLVPDFLIASKDAGEILRFLPTALRLRIDTAFAGMRNTR